MSDAKKPSDRFPWGIDKDMTYLPTAEWKKIQETLRMCQEYFTAMGWSAERGPLATRVYEALTFSNPGSKP